ncbi:MAG: surface carbohydrate biosynthesis protein [Parvicella sp.]|jgi:surface carbohydrate biosynthesis protein
MNHYAFIPVEVFTRSFKSRFRIAYEFARLGGTAIVGDQREVKYLLSKIDQPVSLLSKGEPPTEPSIDLVSLYKKKGFQLFLLDEEGGIVDKDGQILQFRYDIRISALYDQIYLWGDKQKSLLAKYFPNLKQLLVSGNPRFDTLHYELQTFLGDGPLKDFLGSFNKTVSVNTSFPAGNTKQSTEDFLKMFKNLLREHYSERKARMHVAHHNLLHHYFCELIEFMATDFPSIGIIIRPHPSENEVPYMALQEKYVNVYVDAGRKYEAGYMSKICDLTIHHDCTTGIEALMSNSKVVSYAPYENELSQPVPLKSTLKVGSYEEVKSLLLDILDDKDHREYNLPESKLIRSFIQNYKSSKNTAEVIATDIYSKSIATDGIDLLALKSELAELELRKNSKFRSAIRKIIRSNGNGDAEKYINSKRGSIDSEDVASLFQNLEAQDSREEIYYKALSARTYVLYSGGKAL